MRFLGRCSKCSDVSCVCSEGLVMLSAVRLSHSSSGSSHSFVTRTPSIVHMKNMSVLGRNESSSQEKRFAFFMSQVKCTSDLGSCVNASADSNMDPSTNSFEIIRGRSDTSCGVRLISSAAFRLASIIAFAARCLTYLIV